MRLILNSFGFERGTAGSDEVYYRMPPVRFDRFHKGMFLPDFPALLLADRVVVDGETYRRLTEHNTPHQFRIFGEYLEVMDAEGLLEIQDYQSVLADRRELVSTMTEVDATELGRWMESYRESSTRWGAFVSSIVKYRTLFNYEYSPGHSMMRLETQRDSSFANIRRTSQFLHEFVHLAVGSGQWAVGSGQ